MMSGSCQTLSKISVQLYTLNKLNTSNYRALMLIRHCIQTALLLLGLMMMFSWCTVVDN